jgi:quercetin dioxygenase-like cupin family protein
MNEHSITAPLVTLPADNLARRLKVARPDTDESLPHIGLVGDTYTILLSGADTDGRYCLIDMHIPPGGGPPPHRHDFEESFTVLEGEIEATFCGEKSTVHVGQTVSVPANAPHSFTNASGAAARLLCICAPAGQEEFFAQVGVTVPTRRSTPPKLDEAAQAMAVRKIYRGISRPSARWAGRKVSRSAGRRFGVLDCEVRRTQFVLGQD